MSKHPNPARPIMTDEQHAKLQDLCALCNLCNYREICTEHCIRGNCPNTTGEYEAFKLPEDCIDFDHYATKVATERIYEHLKAIRKIVMMIHPENPYMVMFLGAGKSNGRIMFNNTHWELPKEKKINFREPLEAWPQLPEEK